MYSFIDVNEASESVILPSEALQINGEYIENLIKGYRTLSVSGREALSPELDYFEVGTKDGSSFKNKRYPSRTITVKYQIIAHSSEEFRQAYNKLGGILNVEDAELIFNDETDKYYIGTPSLIRDVEAGRNCVEGEFEIFCADPFKYSVVEYEAVPGLIDDDSIMFNYNGTYKSFPTLEADFPDERDVADDGETAGTLTGSGDCGYVAFFNENKKIIQLGDPDEKDSETVYPKAQTLTNQTFLSTTAWGTTAKNLWAVNKGIIPVSVSQNGAVGMAAASYTTPPAPTETSGTIFTGTSIASRPYVDYNVVFKSRNRTASSVNLTFSITAALAKDNNYFGNGYRLVVGIYDGSAWHDICIKETSDYWRGRSGHTVSFSINKSVGSSVTSISGFKFRAYRTDGLGQTGVYGETAMAAVKISSYQASEANSWYLAATNYGSGSAWHGAAITRTLGADAAGETGAANFAFTYKQKMCIGAGSADVNQLGGFHVHLSDSSGTVVAGVRVVKTAYGKSASLMMFVNGSKVHQVGIDISYYNKYFGHGNSVQTSTITKTGSKVVFNIGGYSKTFTNSDITSKKVTKITFMFEKYGSSAALSYNGLYACKFVKNNCTTTKDIPNKFSANDIVKADCKNGKIYLNGVLTPSLGALGNDWEGFYLTPGLNQIGFSYSDWVPSGYAPRFKVKYREVFL